ncbi:MAG TPA: M23 family metallopeptidase [Candidatus Eisenbacteria bacterium]|nr:M23 family metallopeptidase [Candidatus Eisenbacteria bacterium]
MNVQFKPSQSKSSQHGSPERLGLISALVLSLTSLGGLLALLASVLTMEVQTRVVEARANSAALSTQVSDLHKEMASLDRRLDGVWDQLLEARLLVGRTRLGYRHLDTSMTLASDASGTQLDETIREAREVSDCFEDILTRMEGHAAAWQGLPSILPIDRAEVTSRFGLRRDPLHGGLDWHQGLDLSASVGTTVHASAAGTVIQAGYYGDYGLLVEIDHGNGLSSRYGHLSRVNVRAGDRVTREDLIGLTGATGRVSAPHLHYEILVAGRPVNPEPYILADLTPRETGATLAQVTAAPQN